jgi:hypothetical protein
MNRKESLKKFKSCWFRFSFKSIKKKNSENFLYKQPQYNVK